MKLAGIFFSYIGAESVCAETRASQYIPPLPAPRSQKKKKKKMDQLHAEIQLRKMQDEIKTHSGKKRIALECQYMENVTKFLDISKKPRPVVAGPSFKVLKKNCEQMGTKGNNLRRFVTIEHTKPLTLTSKKPPAEEDTASSDPESCGQCGSIRAAFDDKQCAEICLDCGNTVFKPCGNGTHAEALDQIFRGQNVWKSSKTTTVINGATISRRGWLACKAKRNAPSLSRCWTRSRTR